MKKFGIVIICIIFFALVGPVFLVMNFHKYILSSPENIKNVLIDINAYERLTKIKAKDLIELIQPDNRDEQSQIPEATLQKMIDSITPQMAQKLVEQALDSYYGVAKNGNSDISIDLREIKNATLSTQPVEIRSELSKSIPDEYTIKNSAQAISLYSKYLSGPIRYLGLAVIIILALSAICLGTGLKGKLATAGVVFALTATSLLLIRYLATFIPFASIAGNSSNAVSQEAFSVLRDFAREIWGIISNALRRQGLLSGIIAFVIFVVAAIIPGRPRQYQDQMLKNTIPPKSPQNNMTTY